MNQAEQHDVTDIQTIFSVLDIILYLFVSITHNSTIFVQSNAFKV